MMDINYSQNRKRLFRLFFVVLSVFTLILCTITSAKVRKTELFTKNWKFYLGDEANGYKPEFDDSKWRLLNLPHDWSIEGAFSKDNPATPGGGALPGGIGWYRKSFLLPESDRDKLIFIEFDGVFRNSEVWVNGHYLGKRPYGYSTFRYELTPFLKYGKANNVVVVKVDNSKQPNSRWYTGSGIYRNVWLVTTNKVSVGHWGTFITTPSVSEKTANVSIEIKISNASKGNPSITIKTDVYDKNGKKAASSEQQKINVADTSLTIFQEIVVRNPMLWSVENPNLYKAVTTITCDGKVCDDYETTFGIRAFNFDRDKGFSLNGKPLKIKGVCNHHDLGCLSAAINVRALERQLEIMKEMGVNGIRTSHNPPAPELLDLCDKMGFIVMDEAFDVWKNKKSEFDYALDWGEWHVRDLQDMVLRDRNHPSIFMWSIGNEVNEQWNKKDSIGIVITKELVSIIKALDTTRPVTANLNDPVPDNPLVLANALDLIGFSYHHNQFQSFLKDFPGKKFIGSETTSSLATRGKYDMPSDSVRRWPIRWDLPFTTGNKDNTCSSYDNCSAPWGSTHEESWRLIKKYDFLSGMYIWTGFDYLGEPTPYDWPSRSSYFGIVDLAGFPKDAYYMYQSEWTDKPVLHIFPHWNWKEGDTVDVWAYTNCEDVELFLNGKSLGIKKKTGDDLHLMWRVPFQPGVLKAAGLTKDNKTLVDEVKTAGTPSKIILEADRQNINADGEDLSFITIRIYDEKDNLVPHADNLINFSISGEGTVIGVDNGLQTSHEPFNANYRKAFNGMCLAVIRSTGKAGKITVNASSDGLEGTSIEIMSK